MDFETRFSGIGRLMGTAVLDRLRRSHVCVVGIGGVGSWVAEALARSGVGALTLIDLDDVCASNTNRQIHAMVGTVGAPKVDVMAARVRLINPDCTVNAITDFFTERTAASLVTEEMDWVVDGIDHLVNKCILLDHCRRLSVPVVTTGGAGGRRDPSKIMTGDLSQTGGDGLLRRVRKQLRRVHAFPSDAAEWGIPCIYSRERVFFPTPDGGLCETPPANSPLKLDCSSGFGTASFVTGTFGFMAAAVVVEGLAQTTT